MQQQLNSTAVILREPSQVLPFCATAYISRVTPQGSLASIASKIEQEHWQKCSIYNKQGQLVLVVDSTLQVFRLSLRTVRDLEIQP